MGTDLPFDVSPLVLPEVATALFAVSIVAVFGLLHSLASLSLGESTRGEVLKSVALLIFVVVTMTAARHQAEHPASAADATREQIQFTRFSTT